MTMPGCAPFTPDLNEPSMLVISLPSSSWVFSPKYQTLPSLSCAYQSSVSSVNTPPTYTVSWTSTQVTPRITLVLWVTKRTLLSLALTYVNVVPGRSGKNGLLIVPTKFDETI